MNNEEKILAILEQMNSRLGGLEQGQAKLEKKMDKGFERLENLINVAAKDAARTEKRLDKHLRQPHIA